WTSAPSTKGSAAAAGRRRWCGRWPSAFTTSSCRCGSRGCGADSASGARGAAVAMLEPQPGSEARDAEDRGGKEHHGVAVAAGDEAEHRAGHQLGEALALVGAEDMAPPSTLVRTDHGGAIVARMVRRDASEKEGA